MASFHEKNGMWGMRARVRTKSGFQYQTTPFLWNSKSEAEHDASLFIWYRSLKDSSDPLIPTPVGRWFKSMLPNSDWDSIRDHLVNRVEKKISGLKRKVGQIGVAISSQVAKRKMEMKAKAEKEPPEAEMVHDERLIPREEIIEKKVHRVMAMRKNYSELSARRRCKVNKNVEASVRAYWNQVAPNQSDEELQKCLGTFLPCYSLSDDCMGHATKIAYSCAAAKKMEDLQTQIISTFVLEKTMTRQKLESIVGSTISARKYSHAKFHAVNCGPGQPLVKIKTIKGAEKRREVVEKFVEFLMDNGVITANGRSVSLPGVETYCVPNIKRVEAKQSLIKSFEAQERLNLETEVTERGDSKRQYISMRRESMEDVIAIVCPEKHCSLAALDVVGQQHGFLNFRVLRKKLEQIQLTYQQTKEKMSKLLVALKSVEETLSNRNMFKSDKHFCAKRDADGPAIHCHYYAFGKCDPSAVKRDDYNVHVCRSSCGHYHQGTCLMCDEIETFGLQLESAADGECEDVKSLMNNLNIDYHARRFRHYTGHQARLAHEQEALNNVKEELKIDPKLIFITADYAMKFLPLKDSEAQNEFFGKAGINWHGLGFLWFCNEEDVFKQYFVNQCVEDSTEDGISVVALLSQALQDHKKVHPHHEKLILQSDGAGCYSGFGLMSRLGYLFLAVGVKLLRHYTGESGGGKSAVDQIFGQSKEGAKRVVTLGQGALDITDAASLSRALNYKPIKKTINYAVTLLRGKVMEPILNKSARDAKLQSHSTRTYHYDLNGHPTEVLLEDQSFLPTEGPQKVVTISGVWPESYLYPFPEIVPTSLKIESNNEGFENIPGPREISKVTTTYVSRLEKEEGIQNRKHNDEARKALLLQDKRREENSWERKSKAYARRCGVKSYLLCTKVGCIRQVTTYARLRQHEESDHHQSNGNPRSQSSDIKAPHELDGFSVKELALNYLVLKVGNTDDKKSENEERVVNNDDVEREDQLVDDQDMQAVPDEITGEKEECEELPIIYAVKDNTIAKFGWAKRASLKHPGFTSAMANFLKWIFYRGNEKGNSKFSPSAMLTQAANFGTPSLLFEEDPFWIDALARSGGNRVFTDAEIPEEWQVKQYVCQLSTSVKQKQKASSGVQVLTSEVKLVHLTSHLSLINDLPMVAKDLAERILGLGAELTTILQKDLKDIVKLAAFTPMCKRAVIEACKKVGRVLPSTADVPVLASANDDLDAEIEAEIAAQHLHAAEHSYDDFELDSN